MGYLTVKHPFAKGVWHVTHDRDEDVFYILYEKPPAPPQIMFICKGTDVFSTMAECVTVMYGELHPEVRWSDSLQDAVTKAISE